MAKFNIDTITSHEDTLIDTMKIMVSQSKFYKEHQQKDTTIKVDRRSGSVSFHIADTSFTKVDDKLKVVAKKQANELLDTMNKVFAKENTSVEISYDRYNNVKYKFTAYHKAVKQTVPASFGKGGLGSWTGKVVRLAEVLNEFYHLSTCEFPFFVHFFKIENGVAEKAAYPLQIRKVSTTDYNYGAVVFGEQNWTNLRDEPAETPRADYVMGHDLDGEHRGVTWEEEEDLVNFLEGSWVWYDKVTGGPGALVTFSDYRRMAVMPFTAGGGYFELYLDYDHIYADRYDAPDLICTKPYNEDTEQQMKERSLSRLFGTGGTGDYLVSAIQLDGEQILTLDQANNGEGILGYILPGAGENDHSFELYRYTGTMQEENQGGEEPGGAPADQDQTIYDPNRGIDIPWSRITDSFEAMQDWDEVAEKVDLGMDVYFDSVEEIGGKYCYVFDFGTDHPENYVHEDFYAISEDLRTVYRMDYMTGEWDKVRR